MATHHSADARTALMATYIARYANPRAGMRFMSTAACTPRWDDDKGIPSSGGCFGARGRTIYNAEACPMARTSYSRRGRKDKCGALRELERIETEEERRRGDQFLMAARGDFEETSRESTPNGTEETATAEKMFALYTHI